MNLSESHEVTWGAVCEKFQRVARLLREADTRAQGRPDRDLVLVCAWPVQQQALEDLAALARLAADERAAVWRGTYLGGAAIADRMAARSWWPGTRAFWRRQAAAWRACAAAGPPQPPQHYRPGKAV